MKKGAVIALIVAAGGMLAAMVFVLGFHTKEVRFHGNTRMTNAELNDYIFADGLPQNSLMYKYFGSKDRSLPFASEYEVSLRTPEIIDIYVNEKPLVGYVRGEDEFYYIDDSGCVAEISDMSLVLIIFALWHDGSRQRQISMPRRAYSEIFLIDH